MKLCQKIFGISVIALAATACDEASKSNPATAARDELNPPTGLVSLTGDTTVTLRWLGNNTEDDFKGYHVFMADGDYSGKTGGTVWTATYPAGASLEKGSVPRCKDNNTLFTSFKFPESTNDCEGDTATDSGTSPTGTMALQEDEEAPLPFAKCEGKSDANLSVPVTDKVLGMQECKITGLTNGKTYTFVVMAVMGSEFENVSWSSNFVADTPANAIFSGELTFPAVTASGVTPAKKTHIFLSHADILAAVAGTDLTADKWQVKDTCPTDFCSIASTTGNLASNAGGIYLGRFGGSKPARIFFSAPDKADTATDGIVYLYRGGQTFDPANPSVVATTIPDDQANTDTANNYTNGTLVDVLGNEVIDIAVQNGANWHFGKLVMDIPALTTPADATSEIKVKVTLIVQPTAGNPHYLQ